MRTIAVAGALVLIASIARAQPAAKPVAGGPTMASTGTDSLAIARKYTTWFYTGQMDSLWSHQSADAKKDSSPADLMETLMQLSGQFGIEEKLIEERFVKRLGKTQYWRTARFSGSTEPFMFRIVLTPQGEVAGLGFNPSSQAPAVDP